MATANEDNIIETNPLKPVNEAVGMYRVIEDGALAHHLQQREIEYHHACNVEQRRTVMGDIKTAKQLQDEEDRRAKILTVDQQEELKHLDGQLAEVIQGEMIEDHLKQQEERKEREKRDEEIALKMTEKEKIRERRQQARDHQLAKKMSDVEITGGASRQKLSDEELARRLQEQEKIKVKNKQAKSDHIKAVIEMQDEELARFIYERDREEAEMMKRREYDERHRRKHSKQSRHSPHPAAGYPPELEHPHHSRQGEPAPIRWDEKPRHKPPRPAQPRRNSDETIPMSVQSENRSSLERNRHTTHGVPARHVQDHPQRSYSEHPRRPAPHQSRHHDQFESGRYSPDERRTNSPHHQERLTNDVRNNREYRKDVGREREEHRSSQSDPNSSRSDPRYGGREHKPTHSDSRHREHELRPAHSDPRSQRPVQKHGESGHPYPESLRSDRRYEESQVRSGKNEDLPSDNPWERFPQDPRAHGRGPPDDIHYGEGLSRLTAQEAWYRDSREYRDQKKKSKGDCKQQ